MPNGRRAFATRTSVKGEETALLAPRPSLAAANDKCGLRRMFRPGSYAISLSIIHRVLFLDKPMSAHDYAPFAYPMVGRLAGFVVQGNRPEGIGGHLTSL